MNPPQSRSASQTWSAGASISRSTRMVAISAFSRSTRRRVEPLHRTSCCSAQVLPSGSLKKSERAPGEVLNLADLDAALDQLGAGRIGVLDDQLQAFE